MSENEDAITSQTVPTLGGGRKKGLKCNFCDVSENLEWHHIIPKSLGGTDDGFNLLLVCPIHHGILHGMRHRANIRELTKAALQAKKARGETLGPSAAVRAKAQAMSSAAVSAQADAFAEKLNANVTRMLAHRMTLREMAEELNASGIKTARGGQWHASTVKNLIGRIDELAATTTESKIKSYNGLLLKSQVKQALEIPCLGGKIKQERGVG